MKFMLMYIVKAYQHSLGLILPAACRFEPTCSSYAIQALERHGALTGSLLALKRILRCNPWMAGGHDPVPKKTNTGVKTIKGSCRHE